MSSKNRTSLPKQRTVTRRADPLDSCDVHAPPIREGSAIARAEHPSRTDESRRAERAHLDWSLVPQSKRPLSLGRAKAADALDGIMTERWLAKDLSATNVAVAELHLGVDEKLVRQWREDDKPFPAGAIYEMPPSISVPLLEGMLAEIRGAGHAPGARGTLGKVVDAIAELRRCRIRDAEVDDARAVLRSAIKDATQLLATLETP